MQEDELHLCDLCHKRYAHKFLEMGPGGRKVVRWLCPECAKLVNTNSDFIDELFSGMDDMIEAVILGNPMSGAHPDRKSSRRVCPVCGATEEEIASKYKFGCSECYKVFYDLAHSYIAQLGGSEYKGKGPSAVKAAPERPKQERGAKSLAEYVEDLRRRMHEAGEKGDYDLASQLKHQIESLTGEGGGK